MHRYIIDKYLESMKIPDLGRILDEVIGIGYDYFKICGTCDEFKLCVYIGVIEEHENLIIKLLGLTVSVPYNKELDEKTTNLLKYSSMIIGEKGMASFYIPRTYTLGVYYVLCGENKFTYLETRPVELEEVLHLIEGAE